MKARIKMRQMPGDVPKRFKIQMMEGTVDESELNRAKSFRKMVRMKERAVLKRRAMAEIMKADRPLLSTTSHEVGKAGACTAITDESTNKGGRKSASTT